MTYVSQQTQITKHLMAHRSAIYGFILAHVRKVEVAEDIFQEVCTVICEKWARYDQSRSFRAWALGIAYNEIRGHRRQQGSDRLVALDPSLSEGLITDQTWDENDLEDREALQQCLKRLSERSRRMLRLRYNENKSPEDIGRVLGWKSESVSVAMSRTRRVLHDCITRTLRRATVH